MMDLEKEIPKHKKKKKSSTSKAKSKADHKHEYEDVLFIVPKFWGEGTMPCTGSRCKICGKIGGSNLVTTKKEYNKSLDCYVYKPMTDEEIYEKYGYLEQVPLESYWQQFAPLSGGANNGNS